jgi:O-antigen/teichoic acid export membrane protein
MATIELPSFSGKETWRKARLLIWSLLAAVVVLDVLNVITIPEYFAGFTMLVYVVATWVVSYHLLQTWRR